jgi:hypothetical protein
MKYIFIFFMTMPILLQDIAAYAAESVLIAKHQNWESRVIRDGNTTVFRAHTTYAQGNDYVVLTLDRNAAKCDSLRMKMNIALPNPTDKAFESPSLFGAMRVDEYPVRNINYVVEADQGEQIAIATVTNFDREASLFAEIVKGQAVRFQFSFDNENFYLRFSLLGSTAALTRTRDLCNQFTPRSDADYFQWNVTTKEKSNLRY